MNNRTFKLIVVIFLFAGLFTFLEAEGVKKSAKNMLRKTTGTPVHTLFNINNISTDFYSDGQSDLNTLGNSGFVFPKGSGKACVFQTGFVWGGKVNGQIRVGGVTYQSGLTPGKILPNGKAEDPNAPNVRIYRVRPDWKTGSMNSEIRDGEGTESSIRDQYQADWNEWPAKNGAPFKDVDGDGLYNPDIDIPGVPGAGQTIWHVTNDLDAQQCASLYGSLPIGIELQTTVWGYSSAGALGNMLFRKYKIINKGNSPVTEMYVSNWSDPDDGNATDDFCGCDTVLSLAFDYNATASDATYQLNPPAVGFDFFQGPIVPSPGDSAIFDGKRIYGRKNLPMTAFYYFINSNAVMTDPTLGTNYQNGTLRFWNLFQGKISTTGEYFPVPPALGGGVTKFPLSGDPVAATGYLDGVLFPRGDRRIGSVSGPFNMAIGDTQEIVVAEIAAGGPGTGLNNIKAVELLKNYDKIAQNAYDNFFVLPSAPEPPKVQVAELDRKVVLNWGFDQPTVDKTEGHNNKGFYFEGYNVYQLPSISASLKEAVRIATYDKVDQVKYVLGDIVDPATGLTLKAVQQFGSDNGIQRFLNIDHDFLTNLPLVNGKKYYYAVTSYAVTDDPLAVPNNLENPLNILTIVPHSADPGVRYNAAPGDTLLVSRLSGVSDGKVVALVVNPKAVTGDDYQIEFAPGKDADGNAIFVWKVTDVTTGQVKVTNMTHQAAATNPQDGEFMVVDGIMIKVFGPPQGMKVDDVNTNPDPATWGWNAPAPGTRRWTFSAANPSAYPAEGFAGAMGSYVFWNWLSVGGSTVTADKIKNIELRLAATDANGNVVDGPNVSYAYRYMRGCQSAAAKPEFAQFIINKTASYDFQDFKKGFPFAAYDVESKPARRLAVGFLENNIAAGLVDGKYWPAVYTAADPAQGNSGTGSPREWFFIFDADYTTTQDANLAKNVYNNPVPVMYMGMPLRRSTAAWADIDVFQIFCNHINVTTDAFKFTSKTITTNADLAKTDVEDVNVFPNPYYAMNTQELNKYQRFVTFSHLPEEATLRIFNLAGQLVRTIHKDPNGGQFQRWDLSNEAGLPVGSGLYLVHIDMPKIGKTKLLKVTVIQEQQILDRF